ncbi:MAG TPA: hypothetical protein VFT34_10900 [Verrucomicrobiae bacterium]|nr:hypothetical protein [Verrucomicrobiae bacterium]
MSLVPLVVLLAFVATVSFANEDTKSNPYESIAARNPFQLNPPPPPPDPNEVAKPPPPPLATVEVAGVMNMLSKKKVLLEIVPGPGKPPLKPTLEEGERVEMVEVLFIDVENSEVKINNGGVITNIALRTPTKAPVGPAGPLPGVQPGFPPPVLAPNTSAGLAPPTINPATGLPNASPYDRGNVMVVGGSPAQATPTSSGVIAKPYGAYGAPAVGGSPAYGNQPAYGSGGGVNVTGGGDLRTIPSRPIRTTPQSTDATQNDPARQYIEMAIQRQQRESRNLPTPPPLPLPPGLE